MNRTVYLYLHTHWDREWYRTFEGYRYRLIQVMKDILIFLESHPESHFLLDGQTILLEDFLALEPTYEKQLKEMISQGRMAVGPWYVLPDEFLVSGEALIRNLQIGISQAKDFGQSSFYGYLPDMFGHISQMPQILKQSQLEPAFLWRGVNPRQAIFDWQSLNGDSITTIHLTKGYYQDAFHDREQFSAKIDPFLKGIIEATPKNSPLLLPVGGDHLGIPSQISESLALLETDYPEFSFRLTSLEAYVQALEKQGFHKETVQGELRNCEVSYVLPGVLSTRIYLKQKNQQLQNLLERTVEPFLAWQWLKTKHHPDSSLLQAWKYLIQNQPHDSICGCSIDEVHQDMMPRFRWVNTLSQELLQSAHVRTLNQSLTSNKGEYLHVFNFSASLWQGALKTVIEFPADEEVGAFTLEDPLTSEQILFEITKIKEEDKFVSEPDILPHWESVKRFHCVLPISVKPFSIRSLKIQKKGAQATLACPTTNTESFSIENEYCRVVMDTQKGHLNIYRKEEHTWVKCLRGPVFFDEGDAGDTYNYSPPIHDQKIQIPFQEAKIETTQLTQRLIVTFHGSLPAQLKQDRQKRSKVNVPCRIRTVIELHQNDARVHFKTRLNNQARDHRLKALFQSLHPPVRCWSSTAFGAIEREKPPPRAIDVPKGKERPADTFPVLDWVHLTSAEGNGFVFMGEGLHEGSFYEWQGKPTLSMTLLRSVGWLSRDDLRTRGGGAGPRMKTPEAQCLGEHVYEYALALTGNERASALSHVHNLRHTPWVVQAQEASPEMNLFEMTPGSLTVTALKKANEDEALILRCVNLNDHPVQLVLKPKFKCESAFISNPLEENIDDLNIRDEAKIQRVCQPYEILTFKFYPQLDDV